MWVACVICNGRMQLNSTNFINIYFDSMHAVTSMFYRVTCLRQIVKSTIHHSAMRANILYRYMYHLGDVAQNNSFTCILIIFVQCVAKLGHRQAQIRREWLSPPPPERGQNLTTVKCFFTALHEVFFSTVTSHIRK